MSNGYLLAARADLAAAHEISGGFGLDVIDAYCEAVDRGEPLDARFDEFVSHLMNCAACREDTEALLAAARELGAQLITTEKDAARLAGASDSRGLLRDSSLTLPIRTVFLDRDAIRMDALLEAEMRALAEEPA